MQIIYNLFEQWPGNEFFPDAREQNIGLLVRVPHSSGMLEGHYTADTVFGPNDHRRHRPRSWLLNGIEKLKSLDWLTEGRSATIGQQALKFILSESQVTTVLPNILDTCQHTYAFTPDGFDTAPVLVCDKDVQSSLSSVRCDGGHHSFLFGVKPKPKALDGVEVKTSNAHSDPMPHGEPNRSMGLANSRFTSRKPFRSKKARKRGKP